MPVEQVTSPLLPAFNSLALVTTVAIVTSLDTQNNKMFHSKMVVNNQPFSGKGVYITAKWERTLFVTT